MSRRPKTARRRWRQWTETEAAAVLDEFATAGQTPTGDRSIGRPEICSDALRTHVSPPVEAGEVPA